MLEGLKTDLTGSKVFMGRPTMMSVIQSKDVKTMWTYVVTLGMSDQVNVCRGHGGSGIVNCGEGSDLKKAFTLKNKYTGIWR